jgi:hypothetical protein
MKCENFEKYYSLKKDNFLIIKYLSMLNNLFQTHGIILQVYHREKHKILMYCSVTNMILQQMLLFLVFHHTVNYLQREKKIN